MEDDLSPSLSSVSGIFFCCLFDCKAQAGSILTDDELNEQLELDDTAAKSASSALDLVCAMIWCVAKRHFAWVLF